MTSCVLRIKDENKHNIVNIFINADGYPNGAPKIIANEFKDHKTVNAIPLTADTEIINGIEDFSVRLIEFYKRMLFESAIKTRAVVETITGKLMPKEEERTLKAGGMYLISESEEYFCDYIYDIYNEGDKLYIKCFNEAGVELFQGSFDDFTTWAETEE